MGKTTVSAAYAVHRAFESTGRHVLLVSTDPAHSLGDVLQRKLGNSPSKIPAKARGKLTAWESNSEKLFRNFINEHKRQLVDTIERGTLFSAAEISSLLETALPGMAEIAALSAIQEATESAEYSDIVVDTAPFGHTLRLFGLPEQFLRLLNFLELSADRDRVLAEHFGGNVRSREASFIDEWRGKLAELKKAFLGASLYLVTSAERFALNESVRSIAELKTSNPDLALQAVVLNRVVVRPGRCSHCHKRAQAERAARTELRQQFPSAKLYVAEDSGSPILGTQGLRDFGAHVFGGKPLKWNSSLPKASGPAVYQLTPTAWPKLGTPLSFVLGKGGVGKTTVCAGLGYWSRAHSSERVEICSVDPAPSLGDVFQAPIGDQPVSVLGDAQFQASELDSLALFRNWVEDIRAEVQSATRAEYSGVHVDLAYERRLFSELLEIVPPGLDEVLAIFQIMELMGGPRRKLIIDMAPTGHALELLRMPERILVWARLLLKSLAAHRKLALARQVAVKIAELEVRARELLLTLKDARRVELFSVMLPEPLPDRETERLLDALNDLGLKVDRIFVNRFLFSGRAGKCRRCLVRAQWHAAVLSGLKQRFPGKSVYVIRDFDRELSGKRGMHDLTKELWRLNQ